MEYQIGTKVKGTYHGTPFTGVVKCTEADWTQGSFARSPGGFHLYITLDSPTAFPIPTKKSTGVLEAEPRESLFLGSVRTAKYFTVEPV